MSLTGGGTRSQEKYRRRKAKKHLAVATLVRPSAAALAEAYFLKSPGRVGHLRADSLALLLSLANIGAHARVLAVETCAGLITGAVAERLGGHGLVRQSYPSWPPRNPTVVLSSFPNICIGSMCTTHAHFATCMSGVVMRAHGGLGAWLSCIWWCRRMTSAKVLCRL